MKIAFLSPNILWLLSLLILPIIVHLFNFRLYKTIHFNNVHLLKEIKKDKQSKNRLKQWLILLFRMLTISALVIAFAQPVILSKDSKQKKADQLYIIIDNSLSMSGESWSGSCFNWAKNKALDILNAYPSNTKVSILGTDITSKDLILNNKDIASNQLAELSLSPFSKPIEAVLNYIEKKGDTLTNRRHIYIISDFQTHNWTSNFMFEIPQTEVFFVHINSNSRNNVYLDTCYLLAPYHNTSEPEHLVYTLVNHTNNDLIDYNVSCFLNDKLKTIATVNVPAHSSQTDTLVYKNETNGKIQAQLSITDFPITFDNHLYFNYNVNPTLNIEVLSEKTLPYIEQLIQSNPNFKYQYHSPTKPNDAWGDVLIVNLSEDISNNELSLIKTYRQQHKNIILVFSDKPTSDLKNIEELFNTPISDVQTSECYIQKMNLNVAPFKNAFRKLESYMSYPAIQSAFYIKGNSKWLIRNGLNQNLVDLINKEAQKTLFIGIPLNNKSFFTHPIVVPLLYGFWHKNTPEYQYVNSNQTEVIKLSVHLNKQDIIHLKQDSSSFIPEQYIKEDGVQIYLPERLQSAMYQIQHKDSLIDYLSVNWNRTESENTFYNIEDLKQLNCSNAHFIESKQLSYKQIQDFSSPYTNLYFYFLVLSLLFILVEILLIRRLS